MSNNSLVPNGASRTAASRAATLLPLGVWLVGACLLVACSSAPTAPVVPSKAEPPAAATAAVPPAAAAPAVAPSAPPVVVNVGHQGNLTDLPIYVAHDLGYFREQGLAVELTLFRGGIVDEVPLMGTGRLDVGVGGVNGAIFNAYLRQVPIKIVADKGSMLPGHGASAISVRKDLADSGQVRSSADLRGLNVAILQRLAIQDLYLERALEQGGLTLNDVNLVSMSYPDMLIAFENRSIDAAAHNEPLVTVAARRGLSTRWKGADEIVPNLPER